MAVPIITLDGPAGSGKGTVSYRLAETLGWHCLDSGALYRITAVVGANRGIPPDDEAALVALVPTLQIRFAPDEVWVDGQDISLDIRSEQAGAGAARVGAMPGVRQALLQRQRDFAVPPGLIADGRDMGTVVFCDAPLKIYLTASAEERAERRYKQLINKGQSVSLRDLVEEIRARDEKDMGRAVSPLKPADDALQLDSTHLTIEEVTETILAAARERGLV